MQSLGYQSTGERLEGAPVIIEIAKKEGWYSRNGSKWQTMPGQMLMYRAASWFIRVYAPELAMGMHTEYQIIDLQETAEGRFAYEVEQNANTEELDIEDAEIIESEPDPEKQPKKEQPKNETKQEQPKAAEGPGF